MSGERRKARPCRKSRDIYKTTNANWSKTLFATSGHREKYLISSYRADRPKRQYFIFDSSSSSAGSSNYSNKMAISDLLNRRVRARPEDDEVYSEASGSDEGSQDGSDAESNGSIHSVSQASNYFRIKANNQSSRQMTPTPKAKKAQTQTPSPKPAIPT
jgi:hypothetical protein